jgi:hypothetical protein
VDIVAGMAALLGTVFFYWGVPLMPSLCYITAAVLLGESGNQNRPQKRC